jgi:hypothetical protein
VVWYFFASSSEALDYWAAELEREGWLGCVGAGDGVTGTVGTDHGGCLVCIVPGSSIRG